MLSDPHRKTLKTGFIDGGLLFFWSDAQGLIAMGCYLEAVLPLRINK